MMPALTTTTNLIALNTNLDPNINLSIGLPRRSSFLFLQFANKNIFPYSTLLDWISEHNILSIVFGETSHTELIRRSSPLLRFLFTQKRITPQDTEMITHLAFSKHDAFRTFVFKALADVADSMSIEELEVMG